MNDFERALQEVFQMSPEEVMSIEVDPFIEKAFEIFEEMDAVTVETPEAALMKQAAKP